MPPHGVPWLLDGCIGTSSCEKNIHLAAFFELAGPFVGARFFGPEKFTPNLESVTSPLGGLSDIFADCAKIDKISLAKVSHFDKFGSQMYVPNFVNKLSNYLSNIWPTLGQRLANA